MLTITIVLLLCGLALLVFGGGALVSGASGLATRWGVSPLLVGLTIVAFRTSAPELMVNILGSLRGETDLTIVHGSALPVSLGVTPVIVGLM